MMDTMMNWERIDVRVSVAPPFRPNKDMHMCKHCLELRSDEREREICIFVVGRHTIHSWTPGKNADERIQNECK